MAALRIPLNLDSAANPSTFGLPAVDIQVPLLEILSIYNVCIHLKNYAGFWLHLTNTFNIPFFFVVLILIRRMKKKNEEEEVFFESSSYSSAECLLLNFFL
jgi:hypothetical protein